MSSRPESAFASGDFDPLITLPPYEALGGEGSDGRIDGASSLDSKSRYYIGAEIGRGGVGVVHEGWDSLLDRKVAIKLLQSRHAKHPEIVARFLNEARITGMLQHPGIVPIFEFGLHATGLPYLVMGLERGETLDRLIARRPDPSVDLARILTIFLQVCETVAYAHEHSVIHRDLKPSNVIVGSFGSVKVADWGSAKILGERGQKPVVVRPSSDAADGSSLPLDGSCRATPVGMVFGTPAYLPPEQARGQNARVDKRSDVFGLGSILCEILTGHPPYAGEYGSEVFRKAANADIGEMVVRLESTQVAVDLISLTRWCVSARPKDRPRDATEVVEVLESYLHTDQRRAERDLVRFFDLSLDMFCIASYDGYFLRVNENFSRTLGYSATELTSRPFLDFVHPDDRARTSEECTSIAFGAQCVRFRNRYRRVDGRYLLFEWNAQGWPEDRAIYAVARDITAPPDAAF